MAYSIIEQETKDLDLFFKDNDKPIHIASAGGQIPFLLAENDIQNEEFSSEVSTLEEIFEIETNPGLIDLLNITTENLQAYLNDFISMARKGFYSYDKTNLGDFENAYFHLVAKPKPLMDLKISTLTEKLLKIDTVLPTDFTSFNLFELIDSK